MTYQVLARKWRPTNFSEMAGQAHVLQTLTHALEQQRLHHAYLFTGTRGVGKTTVARILARCLNCEQGITATPCGKCDACREITEGRFIDLIEVDAASRTRVEDTRELLENVQYAPARGRFKVYLIDEVHMLSTHSFNALLKTLEEPPSHVKFLLATTDPQKLPVTVLSRCLQFHLKNLAPQQIVTYLQSVLTAELIEFEEAALWHLARAASGSMRDALTLLDQSISFGAGKVHASAVSSLLGTPDFALIFLLIEALANRSGADIIQGVRDAAENNPDYHRLLEQMLSVFHRIAIAQMLPDAVDNSEGDRDKVIAQAAALSAEDVQLYYQICQQTLQEMSVSQDKRISFEMGLLRMLAFSPDVFLADSSDVTEKKKPELTQANPLISSAVTPEAEPEPEPEPESQTDAVVAPERAEVTTEQSATVESFAAAALPDMPDTTPSLVPDSNNDWYRIVSSCGLAGISGNILWNCVVDSVELDNYRLILDESQSALFSPDHQQAIAGALSEHCGRSVRVEIRVASVSEETPAARRRREKSEAIAAIHKNFYDDAGVNALLKVFDARIEQDSLEIVQRS
ncbi:MAG: DNA polymerase III subunit gamma/tau [Pseudohongiella sp.]|nr:DNA polymerase III subunit gamma/tau [Pseudohongiella sp.]